MHKQSVFTKLRDYFKRVQFTPTVPAILVTLFALTVLMSLGFWQLRRAEYKRHLLHAHAQSAKQKPISLTELNKKCAVTNNSNYSNLVNTSKNTATITTNKQLIDSICYDKVKVSGYFDNKHNIYLDNKFYKHTPGYEVLTPFIPDKSKLVLLVNRGWIQRGKTRTHMPNLPEFKQHASIVGIIDISVHKPFSLDSGQLPKQLSWPLLIQYVNISQLSNVMGYRFYPFVLRLAPGQAGGFKYDWHPVTVHPEKHIGYAVQWFALAMVLLIIFIVVNLKPKDED